MQKVNFILKTALLLGMNYSPSLLADTQLGNGGDAVVCRTPSGEISKIQLLDFYEKSALNRPFDIALGAPDITPVEKVRSALQRFRRVDGLRAAKYESDLNSFFSKVTWSNDALEEIKDEGLTIKPACPVEQLAIQHKPLVPTDGQYLISKPLWEKIDNDSRAGLILHEIVYHEGLKSGHQDSFRSRFLNVAILSSQMEIISFDNYSAMMKQLGFPANVIFWKSPSTGTQWALTTGRNLFTATPQQPFPPPSDLSKLCSVAAIGGREVLSTDPSEPRPFESTIGLEILNQTQFSYGYYSSMSNGNLMCYRLERTCMPGRSCTYLSTKDSSCQGRSHRLCIVGP